MEMFVLSRLSRQLLELASLKAEGVNLWYEAFEACSSPSEWKEFLARHQKEAFTARLTEIYTEIQRTYKTPFRRVRPVSWEE
ncbi:MAG: hypothetical protein HKM06_04355 [Spirochaetales bacterium]|nr:hypothetical protein [Spirochaetales bacterium]